ncbi:DoxX family protein [Pengzhenrongella frigida]|uniref:DoxX family protein n=1 Tax=Pengzhenrongella frigida TaxID=1259133 RepID=A0A4Q5MYX2_9MICO|nr:DoxX family protein [Cellulomonas sp. HLT2-17]RYV50133.1 DoxX family protein [Cellulomonas sp. HLT2-17]
MTTTHSSTSHTDLPLQEDVVRSGTGRRLLAATRIALGFIFLWAFLDKTFGLHYSTGAAVAEGEPTLSWIAGGTPSQGYLMFGTAGPLKDTFANLAGTGSDWLFMIALLGIGLALILGIGMRIAAVSATILLVLMWLAAWTFAEGSNNPLIDDHLIYALVVCTLAVLYAGDTWGFGRSWARLPLVQRATWLR